MRFYRGLTLDRLLDVWREQEHLRLINQPTIAFHNNPSFDQAEAFQFRDDDGNETGGTFLGAVNSDQTLDVDTNYRVRFEVGETGAGVSNNNIFTLEYDHNSGGFTAVTATSPLQWAASPNYAPGDTTQQIGDGTYVGTNACQIESAATNDGTVDFAGNDNVEVEYCFTIDSGQVADTDTIVVRLVADKGVGNTRTQTATITVNEAAADTSDQEFAATQAIGRLPPAPLNSVLAAQMPAFEIDALAMLPVIYVDSWYGQFGRPDRQAFNEVVGYGDGPPRRIPEG